MQVRFVSLYACVVCDHLDESFSLFFSTYLDNSFYMVLPYAAVHHYHIPWFSKRNKYALSCVFCIQVN